MRIILIHNVGAGDGPHGRASLLETVRKHGHDVEYFTATDEWRSAAQGPVDLVVAVGGDGTVEDVARHLAGSGIPIGVLPLGTANNVASALGIAGIPVAELVSRWADAKRTSFDMGRATGQGDAFDFVESVGVGLLAESIAEITEGTAGYVDELDDAEERMDAAIEVLRGTLRRLEPTPVEMVLDGRRISGDYLLLEIMNFGCAGPRLCFAPDAAPADGLFDIVWADASHRTQLIADLPLFRRGKRPPRPLPVARGRHLTLQSDEYRLHLDDQLRACQGPVEITVDAGALTFLV